MPLLTNEELGRMEAALTVLYADRDHLRKIVEGYREALQAAVRAIEQVSVHAQVRTHEWASYCEGCNPEMALAQAQTVLKEGPQ